MSFSHCSDFNVRHLVELCHWLAWFEGWGLEIDLRNEFGGLPSDQYRQILLDSQSFALLESPKAHSFHPSSTFPWEAAHQSKLFPPNSWWNTLYNPISNSNWTHAIWLIESFRPFRNELIQSHSPIHQSESRKGQRAIEHAGRANALIMAETPELSNRKC